MKSYYRFVGALALFSLVACNSKQVDYLPFQESEDGYWGLIDRKGKVLFAEEFENKYISQGNETDRSIEETLSIGWELLSIFPKSELKRISDKFIDKYYIEK